MRVAEVVVLVVVLRVAEVVVLVVVLRVAEVVVLVVVQRVADVVVLKASGRRLGSSFGVGLGIRDLGGDSRWRGWNDHGLHGREGRL